MSGTRAASALVPADVRGRGPIGRFREFLRTGAQEYRSLFLRAPVPVIAGTVAVAGLTLGGAYAAWMSSSQSTASVMAATVNAATAPSVSYSGSNLDITWNPVTLSGGDPVDSYDVIRHSGASAVVVCSATAPATTCQDASPLVGTVEYGVVARKSQNWTGPESPLTSFTSDQAKPTTNASASPLPNGNGWNTTSVTVTLNATDAGASGVQNLTYRIGGAAPVTVTGTSTSFPVSDEGTTDVTYYATDFAGNVETTKTLTLKIDTVAPVAPTFTGISADTGASNSDQITRTTAQVLLGTAEPGSTVIVKRGTTTMATVTANGGGTWSTSSINLVTGVNNFTATATDPAGNVSAVSPNFPVTLDTAAPSAPLWTTISNDTGVSATDKITSAAAQTVNGTAEAGSTVTISRTVPTPTTVLGTTVASGGTFAYPMTFTVNQSTTLTATATDVAGNVSGASGNNVVRVDQIAPTTAVNSISPAPNAAGWNRSTTTVTIGQFDTGSGGIDRVWTRLNGGTWGSGTAATRNVSVGTAVQGNNVVEHYAVDKAGNVGVTSNVTVKMDSVAPAKPTISSISNDTGTSSTDRITNAASQTLSGAAEANSTVKVIRGGSTIATGTANGSGAYSIPFTLVQGSNSLTVTATDIADNVSSASNAFVVTLDTTISVPTLTGISNDSGVSSTDEITNVAAQTLSGTADPSSTVVVKRGASTLATVTATAGGTFTASVTLLSGENTFTVTSSDVAGNSATSADFPVTLDTTVAAPVFTATSPDTGSSSTDRITNTASQTLSGNAEAGSSVAVTRGGSTLATVTATGGGNFSSPITLVDGVNTFTAVATDVAGNVSATSASFVVTLDTAAPAAPSITAISDDTGTSSTDRITNAASQTLSGNAEANSTVQVFRGGSTIATGNANGSGAYAIPFTLVEGVNDLTAAATDVAGNSSVSSASFAVTLDTVAPGTPSLSGISDDTGDSSTDLITKVADQTVSGSAEAGSTVAVKRGGTTLATVTATGGGTFSAAITLVEGSNGLNASVSDVAGNTATSSSLVVTLDTTTPLPVFTGISNDTGASASDQVTNATKQAVSGTAEPGSTVRVWHDGTNVDVTANGAGVFSVTVNLTEGTNTFQAISTDVAGNVSGRSSAFRVTLDTAAPAAPSLTGISNDTGVSPKDLITNSASQTVSGTAEAGSTVVVERGGATLATVTATGGTFTADITLVEGANTLTATATDLAGNASPTSAGLVVNLDQTAPTVQVTFPVEGATYHWRDFSKGCASRRDSAVCGTLDDPASPFVSGVASLDLELFRKDDSTCLDSSGNFSAGACGTPLTATPDPSWDHDLGIRMSTGFYAVTATVTDVAGNTASHVVNFEIY